MLITARSLTKAYGAIVVLHDVSFVLNASDRIGVVGPNGVGKSTLLRILIGQEEPESGKVSLAPDVEVGYQPQQASDHLRGGGTSIQDLLLQATGNLRQLEERMHELEMAMAVADADHIDPLLNEYSHVSGRFQEDGIHVDRSGDASGFRLKCLGPANFEALDCGSGVERHILRFEGSDTNALICKYAAERSGEKRFADMRACAEDHDGAGAHAFPASAVSAQQWSRYRSYETTASSGMRVSHPARSSSGSVPKPFT